MVFLRRAIVLLVVAGAAAGCEKLSARDAARVEWLGRRYAGRYELSTSDNLYLLARARPGVTVDSAEAETMFRDFFFAEGKRLPSSLVYLNLYDDSGEFLYQLAYDPTTRRIVRGRTEAY